MDSALFLRYPRSCQPAIPERFGNLVGSVWLGRLPQFDRISLGVVQPRKPADGIGLWVNLDRDSCSFQLGCHFVQIMDSEVHHPHLLGVAEIVSGLRERSEHRGTRLLLPDGIAG